MSDKPSAADGKPVDEDVAKNVPGSIVEPKPPSEMLKQLFIWGLVILVGCVFGISPSLALLGNKHAVLAGGVSEADAMKRAATARKLQDIIQPSPYGEDNFVLNGGLDSYANRIRLAEAAAGDGLKPDGAVLDNLVKDFLNKPLPRSPGRRYADALADNEGGKLEVSVPELRRFISERFAVRAMVARRVSEPAVPLAVATVIANEQGDKVVLDQVVINAKPLLPEVKDDDPEMQQTYEKLRAKRFVRPASAVVTVVSADLKALADRAVIADAEIEKYYAAHKESYRKPSEAPKPPEKPDAPPPPPPAAEYKTLAEVTAEIRETLRNQAAADLGKKSVLAFEQAIDGKKLEDQDAAAFKKAASEAGLAVKENLQVPEPKSGELDIPEFGKLNQDEKVVGLFASKAGFISAPVQSGGDNGPWLLIRLNEHREAGVKELSDPEVRHQVATYLAGQRAYKPLLEAAEAARAAAEKLGPGGLRKYFASEAAAKWEAKPENATQHPLMPLRPPSDVPGGLPKDPRLVASLALPAREVMVVESGAEGDVPSVKLVQVAEYKPGEPLKPELRDDYANMFRGAIGEYRQSLMWGELQKQLNGN